MVNTAGLLILISQDTRWKHWWFVTLFSYVGTLWGCWDSREREWVRISEVFIDKAEFTKQAKIVWCRPDVPLRSSVYCLNAYRITGEMTAGSLKLRLKSSTGPYLWDLCASATILSLPVLPWLSCDHNEYMFMVCRGEVILFDNAF